MEMNIFTPKSFNNLLNDVKSKSEEEIIKMMIDKFEIIAGTYQANVDNGGQLGSMLLVIGAQMACDGLTTLSDSKRKALVKVFGDFIENEDQINEIVFGYKEETFDTLSQITKIFDSEDFAKDIFSYLIGVAYVGGENKTGIENVRKLFEAWF